ncbi:Uncharacterized protein APZ42_004718 [Daphnia magna]|uniref:Uncharacterized protein n=1 Tax=Daphnia magna TaxID=35525 RepID=A0A164GVS4_9CRUS|nr:Uncharacterized protein APZ42_004718 [Daphnia magna]
MAIALSRQNTDFLPLSAYSSDKSSISGAFIRILCFYFSILPKAIIRIQWFIILTR